jgi:CubicO group peptidase (beta-lactamase class C family)
MSELNGGDDGGDDADLIERQGAPDSNPSLSAGGMTDAVAGVHRGAWGGCCPVFVRVHDSTAKAAKDLRLTGAWGMIMCRLFDTSNNVRMRVRPSAWLCSVAAVLLMFCTPARPLDDVVAIPDALDRTFKEWMSQSGITTASLAVMTNGIVVKSLGYGQLQAAQPAPIASLSKAITAVCVARLVDTGRLSFTAPLGTVLAPTIKKLGEPIDARFKVITIEQLLRHRSGLPREPARVGTPSRNMSETFSKVLLTQLETDPGTKMLYSNIGYLTLGMVVEALTGGDYESHCRNSVLQPMKASGSIDPELRWRAPNGGWRIAATDYAKFVQAFDPGSRVLGSHSREWLESQKGNPDYGLGTFMRHSPTGIDYWHDGSVATSLGGGSYFTKATNGSTAVAIYVRRVEPGAHNDLGKRITRAIYGQPKPD